MDQIKIGRFIAATRKGLNMTQRQLADALDISDKTISKWECGKGLPEVSLMLPLCDALQISVNELLTGERISQTDYQEKAEDNIMDLMNENEKIAKEKKHSIRKGAIIAILLTIICVPLLILGWNQYHNSGLHFTNMDEYSIANDFMKLITDSNYENAFEYIDIEELRFEWTQEWFDEKTLSNLETDALTKFCEYGNQLEKAGGIDGYEYIGITMWKEDADGNKEYRLMYNVQIADQTHLFQIVVSKDGIDDFGCDGSFVDDPLALFSTWAESLWQDYKG